MKSLESSSEIQSTQRRSVTCNAWILYLIVACGAFLQTVSSAPVEVDLTTFTSGGGARFIGTPSSQTGRDVAIIGDHNGDGFTDYILSSMNDYKVVIVMKKDTTYSEVNVNTVVSGQYFRVIRGPAGSSTGSAVGGIGDINGDGFDDVIIGSSDGQISGRPGFPGYAYVIFGKVGPFTNIQLTATWAASSIGFMILGPEAGAAFLRSPRTARGLGDVNGDGYDDFAVSARQYAGTSGKTQPGVVWLIFGRATPSFDTIDLLLSPNNFGSNGIFYSGGTTGDFIGFTVMPAGDFNGDGIADFLIGSNGHDSPPVNSADRSDAGAVYLFHGSKTGLVTMDLSTFVTGSKGVRFLGAAKNDQLGQGAGAIGDVNGDGIDDIAISAPLADPLGRNSAGVVYVIFGTRTAFTADVDMLNFAAASAVGFAIYGRADSMGLCAVVPAGDYNGDGVNDILIGGMYANSRIHIVYGQTAVRTGPVDTLTDDVVTFYYLDDSFLGTALDGGKDLNGDGVVDLLLSGTTATVTPAAGGSSLDSSGAVWMIAIAGPTKAPSVNPSAPPSEVPSMTPSVDPAASPVADPTTNPTHVPTMTPSYTVTWQPTFNATVSPSQEPTAPPTVAPTVNPTLLPTAAPSALSPRPSAMPSVTATARPTSAAVKNFELVVNVEQPCSAFNKTTYDAQQAAYNRTIQYTMADSVDGLVPERVADVVVEEADNNGRYSRGARARALSTSPLLLKYKITINDPFLTVEKLRAGLDQAVNSGTMEANFRAYAAQFGATGLSNGTFGAPQVTNAAVQRDASVKLTGVQIALLVIGVIFALGLLVALFFSPLFREQSQPSPATRTDESLDRMM